MKYLLISGSLRKDSIHTKLLRMAVQQFDLPANAIANLNEFSIPLYSGDIEALAIPAGVLQLADLVAQAQSIIIASPEYNYSISGVLKNTVDWLSRVRPMPLTKKPILLMSASPGQIGGVRGAWQTRIPFEGLGNYVYPQMFSLSNSFQAIVDDAFVKADDQKNFSGILNDFQVFANSLVGN
jgi:chromate reductase, NAD(P)H dehydrogenase (quinone)